MKKRVISIILASALISIILQIYIFNGFNKDTWEALNINFLAGLLSLILTYLIIDRLLDEHDKKRKVTFISKSISNEYKTLLGTISQYYISYVTKKPPETSKEIDEFDKVIINLLGNMDDYINGDFLRNGITVIQPKFNNGWIEPEKKVYGYQEFCEITKQTIRKSIDEFFIKYNSLIPEEVILNLSNVNNYFLQPIFTTGFEQGIRIDLTNAQFDPKHFKEPIEEIGKSILELYKFS